MYKRSFYIKNLPPITLENFKNYSIKEYTTNNVTLIEVNQEYYLVKNIDDVIKINQDFFDFLLSDKIAEENKTIYIIPLTGKLNIILEQKDENTMIASVYFKTIEEAFSFTIPKFFGKEIEKVSRNCEQEEYINIDSNDIIFLVASIKDLNLDNDTKKELLNLYSKIINSNATKSIKPLNINIKKDSKIALLLQYNDTIIKKKMI